MNKKVFLVAVFAIFFLFAFTDNAYCFTDNKIVDSNKMWTIHFSQDTVIDDLNKESITVKESNGTAIKCKLTQGQDKRTAIVNPPSEGYKPGESYKLIIGNKTHSTNNKNIKKEIVISFSIQQQESHKVKLVDMLLTNTDNIVEYGEYVYYINKNDNNSIYRMKKDNSENVKFIDLKECDNLSIAEDNIYFTNKYCLFKMINGSAEITKILDIKNYDKITIYKNSIYYMGKDNFLHTAGLNGEGDKIISRDSIGGFWINEDYIYYRNKQSKDNILWKINLDGDKKEQFLSGRKDYKVYLDYNNMRFWDGYVYFPSLENAYSTENSPVYEKYCNRVKLSNKEQKEKVDIEDTFIDYKEDKKTWHNYFYNKLYCVEENGVKELGANIPKTKIVDVDEDYVYFMDYSEYICRVKKDGSGRERILKPQKEIYGDSANNTRAYGNMESKDYIYYTRTGYKPYGDKYLGVSNLCKIKKDGSENIILQEGIGTLIPEIAFDDKVYGLEWKSPYFNIVQVSEEKTNKNSRILAEDCSSAIHLSNGWIYYISDNTLKRVKIDGSEKETVEVFKETRFDRSRTSWFYKDYLYSSEDNHEECDEFWRKDLKNNSKYQYLMNMKGLNLVGVDDKFLYLIDVICTISGNDNDNRYDLYRRDLESKKYELMYTTTDMSNFKEIGVINGKFYFTRTIHGIKN